MINARVILDSAGLNGHRLTTMIVTFPRFILAEFNTHRILSKNSASSRAIPLAKAIERVERYPFIPSKWWANRPGMSSASELHGDDCVRAREAWLDARNAAVRSARILEGIGVAGVHKQQAARLLEPFGWHTALVSGTEWSNFFALRMHASAQPEFRETAAAMLEAYRASTPVPLRDGGWHLPLLSEEELENHRSDADLWRCVSVGRCARVSYLTHDGKRDPVKDVALHDQLLASGHMSPFEHVARAMNESEMQVFGFWSGNFRGFVQYRKLIPGESDYSERVDGGEEYR